MRTIKLVSYRPLCLNEFGIAAIKAHNLIPFIDSSCRREPDLELMNPSITSLCRKGKFAPHLKVGDIIVYLTIPAKFKCSREYLGTNTYNLTAVLEVIKVFTCHSAASNWYISNGQSIPSNCMIPDNPTKSFDQTGSNFSSQKEMRAYFKLSPEEKANQAKSRLVDWDQEYKDRAGKEQKFAVTSFVINQIHNPIQLTKEKLIKWFGKIPGTQNPKTISEEQFNKIMDFVRDSEQVNLAQIGATEN